MSTNVTEGGGPGGCRFFQIGYVVGDMDRAVAHFTRTMGATLRDRTDDLRDQHGAESLIQKLSHLMAGELEIELIEPRSGWTSVYNNDPQTPAVDVALHHLGFLAEDDAQWIVATTALEAAGAKVGMAVDLPQVRLAYYDTRKTLGHYTELVQRR